VKKGYDDSKDCFETLEETEKVIFELNGGASFKKIISAKQAGVQVAQAAIEVRDTPGGLTGVDTGFGFLNRDISGWQKSDLVILAARPGVGKTAFALNLADKAAASGEGVLIFSLEMGTEQLIKRLASVRNETYLSSITNPKKAPTDEFLFIVKGLKDMPENIFIDDSADITVSQMKTKARKHISKYGLRLIIVDYLQLMSGGVISKNTNREQVVAQISRDLKKLAKELQVTVIALSQLSRQGA
jgi:replicative DNA helicase